MPERSNLLLGVGIGGVFLYSLFRWFQSHQFWFPCHYNPQIKDKTPSPSPSTGFVHNSILCIGDKTPKRERHVHFTTNAPVEIQIVKHTFRTELHVDGV